MPSLKDSRLIRELVALDLPPDDFAVFGSGPMMARGLKEARGLDLIARGEAWNRALLLGALAKTAGGDDKVAVGDIEIFKTWRPGQWDTGALIDDADVTEGIRFVRLEEVLKWKRLANRPKDAGDIAVIERFLSVGKTV